MAIDVSCPECGTHDIRTSQYTNFKEWLAQFAGIYNLRCKRCNAQFRGSLWRPSLIRYARCPRCCRTQLTTWDAQHYNPSGWTVLKLALGAKRYRCNFCRCNFASFRVRRRSSSDKKIRTSQSQPGINA